jgi:hypothetical protein
VLLNLVLLFLFFFDTNETIKHFIYEEQIQSPSQAKIWCDLFHFAKTKIFVKFWKRRFLKVQSTLDNITLVTITPWIYHLKS